MAITKVITIKGETQSAQKEFEKLTDTIQEQKDITIEFEKELLKLERQLKETPKTALSAQKNLKTSIGEVKDAIKEQRIVLKELNNEQSKATVAEQDHTISINKSSAAVRGLNTLTGGLASQFIDLGKAAKKGGMAMKSALASTGIGLIVVALGAIVTHWDEISKFIGLSNDNILQHIDYYNEVIASGNAELRILELRENLLIQQGESTDEIIAQKKALLLIQFANNKALIDNLSTQLEIEKSKIEEVSLWQQTKVAILQTVGLYKQAAAASVDAVTGTEEQKKVLEERKKALQEALEADIQLQIKLDELLNPKEKKKKAKGGKTEQEKEAERLEKLLEKQAQDAEAQRQRDVADRIKTLQAIEDAENEFYESQLSEEDQEIRKKEEEFFRLIELAEQYGEDTTILEEARQEALLEITEKYEALRTKAQEKEDKEREKSAKALEDAKENLAFKGLEILQMIAGKGSKMAKGVAVAQATMSTYQGINAALSAVSVIPDPIGSALKWANAAAVGISGFLNVKNILKTNEAGTGGGGSAGGASAPQPPAFNVVGNSGTSQIAQALDRDDEPIKAYVTSGDMTSQQEMDRNIRDDATIG